jgi:hypothetical protein
VSVSHSVCEAVPAADNGDAPGRPRAITPDDFAIGIVGGTVGSGRADGILVRRNIAATWDGGRLVIETTWSGRPVDAGISSLRRETCAIDGAGLLTVTTKESLRLADLTTTTVSYRKQP